MRIIGGQHKGRVIKTPHDLPVRPTTDFAKEALFNILQHRLDFSETSVLDLFAGTGHISLEFASRGSTEITCVDKNTRCVSFIRSTAQSFGMELNAMREDVFEFLGSVKKTYDLIFADPPYDLANIADIHRLVFENKLLKPGGCLIIEHGERTQLGELPAFKEHRRYGGVNFSFFAEEAGVI